MDSDGDDRYGNLRLDHQADISYEPPLQSNVMSAAARGVETEDKGANSNCNDDAYAAAACGGSIAVRGDLKER